MSDAPAPATAPARPAWPSKLLDLVGSYGLAVVVLLLLFLLTFLGTVEQVEHGLFEVQRRYFESLVVVYRGLGVPIPLPGVYLLMIVFAVNLTVGGVLRLRRGWATAGVLTTHLGILFLLFGGLITYRASDNGSLTLVEGQEGSDYVSYFEWELATWPLPDRPDAAVDEYVADADGFLEATPERPLAFEAEGLPFTLEVTRLFKHCQPRPEAGPGGPLVDGFALHELQPEKEAEINVRGAYVRVTPGGGGAPLEGISWGAQRGPLVVDVPGRPWVVEVRKKRRPLPFRIRLDEFVHERHPGTAMSRAFKSRVTRLEGELSEAQTISMNEPLRRKGFTVFQSEYGVDPETGQEFSKFEVVRNPADQWPLYACIVISLGLLLHFGQKLLRYVRAQRARQEVA